MSSVSERRALTLVTVVFALGVGARVAGGVRDRPDGTPAELAALDAQIARVESARARSRGRARGGAAAGSPSASPRPSAARGMATRRRGERAVAERPPDASSERAPPPSVDLETASEAEIERLPWVGPALAQRIVASREKCGPFGSLQGLTRVYGIGEKLAARLAPHVTFSSPSRPISAVSPPGCGGTAPSARSPRRSRP